jgi:pimeloyl-ACP methyl ester carboxylesterase
MTTWLLLRGLVRETRHWGDFPARLSRALGHADIIMLDLPGNGRLHLQRSPASIAALTEACRQQLQQRGLQPPYQLLALSLGAMVACDWSTRHAQEVRRAVLINTSLRPFSPFYQRLRPRNYAALAGLLLHGHDLHARERLILQLTSNRPPPPGLLDDWREYARQCPLQPGNALRQLAAAMRYRASPQAPAADLLLLCGAADRLVNPHCSATLARQWQVPLYSHPDAGHDLPLDAPDWVVTQVQRWLRERQ